MSRQLAAAPMYRRLAETLADELRAGCHGREWLPTEQALAARFAVNRHTVRRALDELARAGLVSRHQGLGTRIVDRHIDYAVTRSSKVSRNLAELGLVAETLCLDQRLVVAPEAVARRFSVDGVTPDELLRVDTLRLSEGAPLLRLRHWFDPAWVPDWCAYYRGGSTRALLARRYGLRLARRRVRIEACLADGEDALLLRCAKGAPLLSLASDNHEPGGRLVEHSVSRGRADRLAYRFDFSPSQHGDDAEELR
ncbi:GntR family transcriptional regulator [Halotalea alkalilenta]|nr:GntR family transcriptional regulator [Halotalea alkalilenta]